ncbi:MAG: pitrilysin family protein [Bacteroidota bacterium]
MIEFEKYRLENGLTVIIHEDHSTPLVALNILYKAGARNEEEHRTGFAHLFEHLMFGGSVNIPSYDEPLQRAGGENNAFTNNDFTNYYLTIPSQNAETAFWLESDRMLSLAFTEKSLEVQRNVVVEEFRQRYLNQPYGDVWLMLRPLAYKVHPYKWATIGIEPSHIELATLDEVKAFFKKHYHPSNAILCIAGNISVSQAKELTAKWFGAIPDSGILNNKLPQEPEQTEARSLTVERDVPYSNIYKAWHCCSRFDKEFYATDLLSDLLSRGKSSRLYQTLVKEKKLFAEIGAYMLGELDKSLFVVEGKLTDGVKPEDGEKAIDEELEKIKNFGNAHELEKVRNKTEASLVFAEMNVANKALNLSYFEMLGDAALANRQSELYINVTCEDISKVATGIFRKENCSTLYYLSQKNK